jgi:hypothetical protein
MMARLRFDDRFRIVAQELEGGVFLTKKEFEQEPDQ